MLPFLLFLVTLSSKFQWLQNIGPSLAMANPPIEWVITPEHTLSPALTALQTALSRHEKLTGESIKIVALRALPPETSLGSRVEALFHEWQIGAHNRDNGVLIGILLGKDNLAEGVAVFVGYGLEQALTNEAALSLAQIASSEIHPPYWEAVAMKSAERILEELHSPVLAQTELWTTPQELPASPSLKNELSWRSLFVSLFLIAVTSLIAWQGLALETHYTSKGWFAYRPRWINKKDGSRLTSPTGGVLGHW